MLFIKTYYYIFYAFMFALAGICVAVHFLGKLPWNLAGKRRPSFKNNFLPLLRLHHEGSHY